MPSGSTMSVKGSGVPPEAENADELGLLTATHLRTYCSRRGGAPDDRATTVPGYVRRVATLLHFTDAWAKDICAPHRHAVSRAAATLTWEVREIDINEAPDVARDYGVLNVPAVAVAERPHGPVLVGTQTALIAAFTPGG